MCGLCGWVHDDPRSPVDQFALGRMMQALVHRGPDDGHSFVQGGGALGFRRLSIIDLEGGRQPLVSSCGRVALVGNGEIYNFRELREDLRAVGLETTTGSDMEVALLAYLKEGPSFLSRLQGMFALAILDQRDPSSNRVLLARDRLGIKPLYWAKKDAALWFASEPKALLASGHFRPELRGRSLIDYLRRGFVGGSHSAWTEIERLGPGQMLEWASDQPPRLTTWWTPPLEGPTPIDEPGEVGRVLDRAVEQRLVADVPLGGFLSGGVDSAGIAESLSRQSGTPPILCTISFEEREYDEVQLAVKTAELLGARHRVHNQVPDPEAALEILPWFFDEPHADPSDLPTWMVSRVAREQLTVALSGDGGDEVFGGYRRYLHEVWEGRVRRGLGPLRPLVALAAALHPRVQRGPALLRGKTFLTRVTQDPALAAFESAAILDRLSLDALLQPRLRDALGAYDPSDAWTDLWRTPRTTEDLYRTQYADLRTTLPEQLLTKVDRASMAVGLEVRVPFLDHRLVERFAPLPLHRKVHTGRGKVALRDALAERLPAEVLAGAKRGFDVPLSTWLRGPLATTLEEHLRSLPERWFRPSALEDLRMAHASGEDRHAQTLWSLLVLEAWRRRHGCEEVVA